MPPNEVGFAPKPSQVDNISQGTPLDAGVVSKRLSSKLKSLGGDPFASDISKSRLFEATFSPEELQNIPEFQKSKTLEQGVEGARGALDVAEKAATGSSLRVLEEALRTKTDVGAQPLGESDLFKQAGLTGVTTLGNSLNERGREIEDRYGSFINQLSKTSGVLRDQYETSLSKYDRLRGEYKEQADRFQGVIDNFQQQEREFEALQRQDDLIRSRKKEEFQFNSKLGKFVNAFGDIKDVPEEVNQNLQAWESGNLRSSQTSDLTKMTITDERDPNGDNCVYYVRAKEKWLPYGMDSIEGRKKVINQFGHTDSNNLRVGDVVVTSEGNWGHTALVMGFDGDNVILDEANYKAGKVTQGRRMNRDDKSIMGFITNPKNTQAEEPIKSLFQRGVEFGVDRFGAPSIEGADKANEGDYPGIEEQVVTGVSGGSGDQTTVGGGTFADRQRAEAIKIGITDPEAQQEFVEDRIKDAYKPFTESQSKKFVAYGTMREEADLYNSFIKKMTPEQVESFADSINAISSLQVDTENTTVADIASQVTSDPLVRRALLSSATWVNAKLRDESGAAIAIGEFLKEARISFPRTGDSAAAINDQTRRRQRSTEQKFEAAGPGAEAALERVDKRIEAANIPIFATDDDLADFEQFAEPGGGDFTEGDQSEIDNIFN